MSTVKYKGIDTSKWQASKVDYAKAKAAGMDFVFLRIGCGTTKDKCFENDFAAAVAAGLKVGVYFYTLSTTAEAAVYDATRVLGWLNGRTLSFPIGYDVEDTKQKKLSKATNTALYNSFKTTIEKDGVYDAILYTGESMYNTYFDKDSLTDDLWIAKYNTKEPSVGRDVAIWQYSSAAINTTYYVGKLDRNYMLIDTFKGSNAVTTKTTTNPYPVPTKTLQLTLPRTKGNDVKWLQYELKEKNYLTLDSDIDGVFGKNTYYAVRNYQEDHGLLVDGKAGSATRYKMIND